jgi:hypothetical protein
MAGDTSAGAYETAAMERASIDPARILFKRANFCDNSSCVEVRSPTWGPTPLT